MQTRKQVMRQGAAVAAVLAVAGGGGAFSMLPHSAFAADNVSIERVADPHARAVRQDVGITKVPGVNLELVQYDSTKGIGLEDTNGDGHESLTFTAPDRAGKLELSGTSSKPLATFVAKGGAKDLYGRTLDVYYKVNRLSARTSNSSGGGATAGQTVTWLTPNTSGGLTIDRYGGSSVNPSYAGGTDTDISVEFVDSATGAPVNGLVAALLHVDLDTATQAQWGCSETNGTTVNSEAIEFKDGTVGPFYVSENSALDIQDDGESPKFCATKPEAGGATSSKNPKTAVLGGVMNGGEVTTYVAYTAGSGLSIAEYDLTATPVEETGESLTRTITYQYEDGRKAADPVTQTVQAVRRGSKLVNGEIIWGDWEPAETPQDAVSPKIEFYTPDRTRVGGDPFEDVTVTYYAEDTIWVTYVDPDGTTVYMDKTKFLKDGGVEPKGPDDPACPGYSFDGWDRSVDKKGNITYTAKWVKDPTVTYVDEDGKTTYMEPTSFPRGGKEPTAPATPTKTGYDFRGWERSTDDDGNVTYTAHWSKVPFATWVDEDGTTVYKEPTLFENGKEPAAPADPSKAHKTFSGWDRSVDEDGNVTYTAKWTPTHTVTYVDEDGKTVYLEPVELAKGEDEPNAPADPTKAGHTFNGWTRATDSEGNVVYTAHWTKDPTAKWIDEDGKTVYKEATPFKGGKEPAAPADPTKPGYRLTGWDRSVDDEGNVTYTARWTPTATVTYVDPDGQVYMPATEFDREGAEPKGPENPARDGQSFTGWTRVEDSKGNVVYTANWIADPTATWVDEDGTTTYKEPTSFPRGGQEPAAPADPTRDGQSFTGWTRSVDKDGNVTYTAHWSKDPTVTYVDSVDDTVYMEPTPFKGTKEPTAPANPTREHMSFEGWERTVDEDGNVTYTAQWKGTQTVTYVDSLDDTVYMPVTTFKTGEVEPAAPDNPTREGYTFMGWERTAENDGMDITYTALWGENVTVTYVDSISDEVYMEPTVFVRDEAEPSAPADPTKDGYEFKGWDRTVDEKGNVTYTATWMPVSEDVEPPAEQPTETPTEQPTETPTEQPTEQAQPQQSQPQATVRPATTTASLAKTGAAVGGLAGLAGALTGLGAFLKRRNG